MNQLTDSYGRKIEYVRISVTDRCDLRCAYCMPVGFKDYREPAGWLHFDEIVRLASILSAHGTRRIRLTGGEPLLRKNLPDLVARLRDEANIPDVSVSTNAVRLPRFAKALKEAGLARVNISLDSLDREKIAKICGRDVLPQILAGIDAALEADLRPVKINMVLMPGVNDMEVEDMFNFCRERGLTLRMIETMPIGDTGRKTGTVSLQPVMAKLREEHGLIPVMIPLGGGPARYWQTPDGKTQIGFITPISDHFCETCNRVRLSVDGTIYLCLGQEARIEMRDLLRQHPDDDRPILDALRQGIEQKPWQHDFLQTPEKIVRFMSQTGG
ncbi:GTP 3',8-cyclase MoaA [Orrella sp. 11846]|uniref:GTP 3',8-cyclase MoaA n=1 Tax=Orrella sp. 11846 TaxID=3409913 RepID=UPI003B595604